MLDFLFRSRETYRVHGPAHPASRKARQIEIELESLRLKEAELAARRARLAEKTGQKVCSSSLKLRGADLVQESGTDLSSSHIQGCSNTKHSGISQAPDGTWYVAGDPERLGYASLEDARIAAQFMRRAA